MLVKLFLKRDICLMYMDILLVNEKQTVPLHS